MGDSVFKHPLLDILVEQYGHDENQWTISSSVGPRMGLSLNGIDPGRNKEIQRKDCLWITVC